MAVFLETLRDYCWGVTPVSVPADVGPVMGERGATARLINDPATLISDELEGFAAAHAHLVELLPGGIVVRRQPKEWGKVGLCIGHGGGHSPSMCGFVGPGLLDVDVVGDLFSCAAGVRIARGIELADRGAGVVLLVSNHSGDVLNARAALRLAREAGIEVRMVLLGDDVATAPRERFEQRRGLGGLLFALKVGGAAAELGWPIDEVVRVMEKAGWWTATLAVATRPPTHPVTGERLFDLPPGQMEIGVGVHGEAGMYRGPILSAEETAEMVVARLLDDLPYTPGDCVLVLLNGTGGTPLMELHILYRSVSRILQSRQIAVHGVVVGQLFTTQDMGGFSLSFCKVDEELKRLWDAPARGPYFAVWPQ